MKQAFLPKAKRSLGYLKLMPVLSEMLPQEVMQIMLNFPYFPIPPPRLLIFASRNFADRASSGAPIEGCVRQPNPLLLAARPTSSGYRMLLVSNENWVGKAMLALRPKGSKS